MSPGREWANPRQLTWKSIDQPKDFLINEVFCWINLNVTPFGTPEERVEHLFKGGQIKLYWPPPFPLVLCSNPVWFFGFVCFQSSFVGSRFENFIYQRHSHCSNPVRVPQPPNSRSHGFQLAPGHPVSTGNYYKSLEWVRTQLGDSMGIRLWQGFWIAGPAR